MFRRLENYKLIVCLTVLLITVQAAFAQKPAFLPIKKLETKDGLSSPNVRKILQDKFGFMWFATQDGLSRYDGIRFVNFSGNNKTERLSLLSSDIFDIITDKDGNYLWVLSAYGGLNKIEISTASVI